MKEKPHIKDYFNSKCFGAFGAGRYTVGGALTTAVLVATASSAPVVGVAVWMAVFTAGQMNKWNKEATEEYIWKPRITEGFGL